MSLEQAIISYVQSHPNTTFVDLEKNVPGVAGTTAFHHPLPGTTDDKLFWHLSDDAIKAIASIFKDEKLTVFGLYKGATEYYEKAGKTLPDANWFPLVFNAK